MTAYPGAFVEKDGSDNGVTPLGARLALGGLIAHDGSGALEARPGVFYDGVGAVVAGTSDTGTMTYQIRPAVFALQLAAVAGNGIVYAALDALEKVDTGAAPGTGSRTDRIWVRQHHVSTDSGGPDTDTILEFGVAQGAAIPTGSLELATAVVTAGTTHTDTLTITQTHNWVVGAGAAIPVRSQTERDALTGFDGLTVRRLDLHATERHNGTAWLREAPPLPAANLTHKPRRLLTRTATFSLANAQTTAIGTWSGETGDDGDTTGLPLSTTMITVAYSGLYRVDFSMEFPSFAGGLCRIFLLKNGTVGPPATGTIIDMKDRPASSVGNGSVQMSSLVYLNAGDTIQGAAYQNSGSAQTCGSTQAGCVVFRVEYQGP